MCTRKSGSRSRRLAVLVGLCTSAGAHAQHTGDTIVTAGWVHVQSLHTSDTIHTDLQPSLVGRLLGVPDSFDSNGTSASLTKVDTLGINFTHFFADHWSLDGAGGIPARVSVFGAGTISPGGTAGPLLSVNLGDPAVNPLGSARQWSPALMIAYHFAPTPRFQPFVNIGFTYTWFTQARLNPAFENRLNSSVGRQMALAAGKPGPTSVAIDPHPLFAPVFGAGAPWRFAEHWLVVGSVGFAPFATRTRVDIRASDGSLLSTSNVHIDVDALVSGLLLGYVF